MSNKTIKVRITNEELFALGFERVIYNGKEYVDKSPLFLDSTCPLSQAYHQLAAKKANRAKLMEETMRKKKMCIRDRFIQIRIIFIRTLY